MEETKDTSWICLVITIPFDKAPIVPLTIRTIIGYCTKDFLPPIKFQFTGGVTNYLVLSAKCITMR